MVIDARESQILEWPGPKRFEQLAARRRRFHLAARHLIEQFLELFV
jgi:hypothetical protein